MEYWKLNTDESLIINSGQHQHNKIRSYSTKPTIPTLHYSIIPLPVFTTKPIISDPSKEHGIFDWPKGPGFS